MEMTRTVQVQKIREDSDRAEIIGYSVIASCSDTYDKSSITLFSITGWNKSELKEAKKRCTDVALKINEALLDA